MLNTLRLHQAIFVYLGVLWLAVAAITGAVVGVWPVAVGGFITLVLLITMNLRAIRYWNHYQRGSRLYNDAQFIGAEGELRAAQAVAESFALTDARRGQVFDALATLHRVQGNYNDAETAGQQALALQEQIWGSDHPITLQSMHHLGDTYLDIARYAEAEPLLEKVRFQLAKTESLELVRCLQSLGRLWLEQGRTMRAEPMLKEAWRIAQKITPTTSRSRGPLYRQMVQLHLRMNQIEEAEQFAQLAIALAEHPSAAGPSSLLPQGQALDLLAQVRLRQDRLAQAEGTALRSLETLEKAVGPNTPILSGAMLSLAEIHLAQRRWQDAEARSRAAWKLREEYLAPEHPSLAECLEVLAKSLPPLGRLEEAELHLQRAQQIRKLYDPLRLV
jgi:tetratricopeptide (TPR) repeat protein